MGDFKDELRAHRHRLGQEMEKVERGSKAWFALDAATRATDRVYLELFREPMQRVHCQPPYEGR